MIWFAAALRRTATTRPTFLRRMVLFTLALRFRTSRLRRTMRCGLALRHWMTRLRTVRRALALRFRTTRLRRAMRRGHVGALDRRPLLRTLLLRTQRRGALGLNHAAGLELRRPRRRGDRRTTVIRR